MARQFTYDAENRQLTATVAGLANGYLYDGEGRRVQKTTEWGSTTFVNDAFGQLTSVNAARTSACATINCACMRSVTHRTAMARQRGIGQPKLANELALRPAIAFANG